VIKISCNSKLSEKIIIDKFFKKLNLNKVGTYNFENDAAYFNSSRKYKTIVTTDTIVENIDFFSNDPPESIAQKILCVNLSDISAMGAIPKFYTLNLSINSKINYDWLKNFTSKLSQLQKKYNIYLLGGDISNAKQISLTANLFGEAELKNIIAQKNCNLGDDIWVTGTLGNSYFGCKILKNSNIKLGKKHSLYFKKQYLYPEPCMFGSKAYKYINSAIDISDGFLGDLSKILDGKFGAIINKQLIPLSNMLKKILKKNNSIIKLENILNWGDDYELVFTSFKKNRKKLLDLSKKNSVNLSLVGSIIKKPGIFDDSMKIIKNIHSFDHFS
jgi:thiamine-monophosphate kinase